MLDAMNRQEGLNSYKSYRNNYDEKRVYTIKQLEKTTDTTDTTEITETTETTEIELFGLPQEETHTEEIEINTASSGKSESMDHSCTHC